VEQFLNAVGDGKLSHRKNLQIRGEQGEKNTRTRGLATRRAERSPPTDARAYRPIAAVESVLQGAGAAAIGRAVVQVDKDGVADEEREPATIAGTFIHGALDRFASQVVHGSNLQKGPRWASATRVLQAARLAAAVLVIQVEAIGAKGLVGAGDG